MTDEIKLLLICLCSALFGVLITGAGIAIGYHLSRKTQGYRDVLEDQEMTE